MNYPNVIQCLECKTVLVSFHRHDFKKCGCSNKTFVDGGSDYLRCGGKDMSKIQYLKIIRQRLKEKKNG